MTNKTPPSEVFEIRNIGEKIRVVVNLKPFCAKK